MRAITKHHDSGTPSTTQRPARAEALAARKPVSRQARSESRRARSSPSRRGSAGAGAVPVLQARMGGDRGTAAKRRARDLFARSARVSHRVPGPVRGFRKMRRAQWVKLRRVEE